jgi:glycosyltransferase involved in cell wall biosynthesis
VRILILNWRCPKNPRAGGAELFTQEVAKRLVALGDQVEWFSAAFPRAEAEEDVEGVHIVRAGRQWTVQMYAFRRYVRHIRERFDVVIDEVNTVPFFTPLWAGIPAVMLIHQLAREVWWYESPFPVNAIGFAAEPLYLRFYRKSHVFTVSASTEKDLRKLGFSGPITIVSEGREDAEPTMALKPPMPTFLYVGRLSPSKRISDVIRAFSFFIGSSRSGQLWLVGDGPAGYLRKLRHLVSELGLTNHVEFCGRVSLGEKYRRMAQAHMLLMASAREGWGLVVIEANSCGTPAVVYDVPGLRDAVLNERTGLVVKPSPRELFKGMLRLWEHPDFYDRLAGEARRWSGTFSFDTAAATIRDRLRLIA